MDFGILNKQKKLCNSFLQITFCKQLEIPVKSAPIQSFLAPCFQFDRFDCEILNPCSLIRQTDSYHFCKSLWLHQKSMNRMKMQTYREYVHLYDVLITSNEGM
ncbi:hypothetical protein M5689_000709 [Euphorbia peplus]|nr:hypothetical protein M5689_000709 [Euphorbia peplus]